MNFLMFLGALSSGIFVFELLDGLLYAAPLPGRLQGVSADLPERSRGRRSTWMAVCRCPRSH